MSADPRREAAENLETTRRVREVTQALMARMPESDVVPTLDRVARCMELLGDPQRTYRVVHLTGTNGKTSTTRMVERILRETGLRTGRFTSPHLHDPLERISIDGAPIDPRHFLEVWDDVAPFIAIVDAESEAAGGPPLSYFECIAVLALAAFADAPVDVAVIEVGLGGRWDATNVADGDVAVITPIGLDHERYLGGDVQSIAAEKAGIVKPGARVVVAEQAEEARAVVADAVEAAGARLATAGVDFGVTEHDVAVGGQLVGIRGLAGEYDELVLPLFGQHQAQNLALAVAAVESFLGDGQQPLDPELLREAVAGMTAPGRLEVVRRSPTVVVDSAHNPHGMETLARALEESFTFARLVGLVAVFEDKDAEGMLSALAPAVDHLVVSRNSSPRSMEPEALGRLARELLGDDMVTVVENLPDALDLAGSLADEGGVSGGVIATGSIHTAADVRMLLGTTDVS
ncbi:MULTISPECIES: bifunctional folylpolyglutamate synthase/dihydrofolate synthase [Kytococcus]|uniref:tetrahydrofolate synthase n=1 Tax=Kytococcus schroeteri TaxID=138300 RepID=A0A2I1P9J1_9MICO|nr:MULTISPECIES: folylpolyglutamate synthase/dihydrofolate synthase family protein [Kytococcus]OFS06045.1 dihydrofolate synthase [Kytococcus sp. HMSC28H12]PKZ41297.1 bifunctional folylpolyglutamate synthase/dihydrofolate synthase [Kytococcus schroeteri]